MKAQTPVSVHQKFVFDGQTNVHALEIDGMYHSLNDSEDDDIIINAALITTAKIFFMF